MKIIFISEIFLELCLEQDKEPSDYISAYTAQVKLSQGVYQIFERFL